MALIIRRIRKWQFILLLSTSNWIIYLGRECSRAKSELTFFLQKLFLRLKYMQCRMKALTLIWIVAIQRSSTSLIKHNFNFSLPHLQLSPSSWRTRLSRWKGARTKDRGFVTRPKCRSLVTSHQGPTFQPCAISTKDLACQLIFAIHNDHKQNNTYKHQLLYYPF